MVLRLFEPKDCKRVSSIYAYYVENTTASFEYVPPTEEEMLCRWKEFTKKYPFFVVEEDEQVVGYAYVSDAFTRTAFSWNAEISVYLDKDYCGKGLGELLVNACEQSMFAQGYVKVYSLVSAENKGSMRFHERLGYKHFATFENTGNKFGRWISLIWYEKDLSELNNNPTMPKTFQELGEEKIKTIIKNSMRSYYERFRIS